GVWVAVGHYLEEWAGPVGAAVKIPFLGSSVRLLAAGRALDVSAARRQGGEDRVEMLHDTRLAADHHAVAALQSPDAAAGADVHVMNAIGRQLLGAADVVDVVWIAAVGQDVGLLEMWQPIGAGLADLAGLHHLPNACVSFR